jgi:superfamily II DNA/RNA helicase
MRGLTHVINYDVPTSTNMYLHRAGRIARTGAVLPVQSKAWNRLRKIKLMLKNGTGQSPAELAALKSEARALQKHFDIPPTVITMVTALPGGAAAEDDRSREVTAEAERDRQAMESYARLLNIQLRRCVLSHGRLFVSPIKRLTPNATIELPSAAATATPTANSPRNSASSNSSRPAADTAEADPAAALLKPPRPSDRNRGATQ